MTRLPVASRPIRRAAAMGHDVVPAWNPMFKSVMTWKCVRCGRTVSKHGQGRSPVIYGAAVEERCDGDGRIEVQQ